MAQLQAISVIIVHLLFLRMPATTLPYLRIMKLKWSFFFLFTCAQLFALGQLTSQQAKYTHEDTLRGSITPERKWWNLEHYRLQVEVFPTTRKISGVNTIRYEVLQPQERMQIDLQRPMNIDSVFQGGKKIAFERIAPNAYLLTIPGKQLKGEHREVEIYYSGSPKIAKNPPWDGGFTWKTVGGSPFIATSCQGLGASVWWPCKDHMYDEPDSMRIEVTVPKPLLDISNGRLEKVVDKGDSQTFHWVVRNPINNYGVNINIAEYVHFDDVYMGEKGPLSLDYYVLPENLQKAELQFSQVKDMLKAFEYWFGPYPFYEDGYKLVEVPYLGMEHQSSVTYGNKYNNGYLGTDLSGSGWGLKWDYIIIHESGHEWFANNITYQDIADMWVHESFTTYSEALFIEYYYGKNASEAYIVGQRKHIGNHSPIIGKYNVNEEGSGDMYYKGSSMLHTIRNMVDNDSLWRQFFRDINKDFYHQTVTGAQVEQYMIDKFQLPLGPIFDQYLRSSNVPILECKINGKKLEYRITNAVPNLTIPITLKTDREQFKVKATSEWQTLIIKKTKKDKVEIGKESLVGFKMF